MKLTTEQIKNIIKEEMKKVLVEVEYSKIIKKSCQDDFERCSQGKNKKEINSQCLDPWLRCSDKDIIAKIMIAKQHSNKFDTGHWAPGHRRDFNRTLRDLIKDGEVPISAAKPFLKGEMLYHLNVELINADLTNTDLTGTAFKDTFLTGANLSGQDLRRTRFQDVALQDANLSNANLSGVNLRDVGLARANLSGANLSGASIRDLYSVDLTGADLSGADLKYAKFFETKLTRANLSGANMVDAQIYQGADFSAVVDFSGADLRGANMPYHLSGVNLKGAIYNSETKWHQGFDPEKAGAIKK